MLKQITEALRGYFAQHAQTLQCNAGRAADTESALLWLVYNTGSGWGVCVSVAGVRPVGTPLEQKEGRAAVTVRLHVGMRPGLPADADARAENLLHGWALVWSYMARLRWGYTVTDEVAGATRRRFIPAEGFTDGDMPPLPGPATFSRERLKVVSPDGRKEDVQELLLATQEWTIGVSLPVIGPALSGTDDANLYLNPAL